MPRRRGPYATVCPSCRREFLVTALHLVRQHARCRPCIRVANGWQCQSCGSPDPEHPSPCPEPGPTPPTERTTP